MTLDALDRSLDDGRLLKTLQQLLTIQSLELRSMLNQASSLLAEALDADKVDVFLYVPENDSLVALGTSDTPMGRKQHDLGLDRVPRVNGGPIARVFATGVSYLTGHAEQDSTQPPGVTEALGVRSQIDVPFDVGGERRGVLAVVSADPDRFSERDVRFLQAVAQWIAVLTHRAELVEQMATEALLRGRRQAGDELARLTRRQQEVATCVAEGLTNEELAERLSITEGTAANHLQQILTRLDLRNRAQLAAWAVEHGLYRLSWQDEDCARPLPLPAARVSSRASTTSAPPRTSFRYTQCGTGSFLAESGGYSVARRNDSTRSAR